MLIRYLICMSCKLTTGTIFDLCVHKHDEWIKRHQRWEGQKNQRETCYYQ